MQLVKTEYKTWLKKLKDLSLSWGEEDKYKTILSKILATTLVSFVLNIQRLLKIERNAIKRLKYQNMVTQSEMQLLSETAPC